MKHREEAHEMRRHTGTFDFFFGPEHRMKKEEMEEQFKKAAKPGWSFAADAARITDENASSEDRKHTSGEGFLLLSTVTLEQFLGKKKEQLSPSQATKEELPKHG